MSRALLHKYRRENRRVPLLSVGEAGAEVGEVGVGGRLGPRPGDGHEVGGAEGEEEGQKKWTGWMYR